MTDRLFEARQNRCFHPFAKIATFCNRPTCAYCRLAAIEYKDKSAKLEAIEAEDRAAKLEAIEAEDRAARLAASSAQVHPAQAQSDLDHLLQQHEDRLEKLREEQRASKSQTNGSLPRPMAFPSWKLARWQSTGGFELIQYPYNHTKWCYKHNHGVAETCRPNADEQVTVFRVLMPPIDIPHDFAATTRDTNPTTYWSGLLQLTAFCQHLHEYVQFVPKRDKLQRELQMTLLSRLGHLPNQLADFLYTDLQQINLAVDKFYQTMQCLTRQCYVVFVAKILSAMRRELRGMSLDSPEYCANDADKDSAAYDVLELYPRYLQYRSANTNTRPNQILPPIASSGHLSVDVFDHRIWQSYLDHLRQRCTNFRAEVEVFRSGVFVASTWLEGSIYAPALDMLVTGGYTIQEMPDEDSAKLPRFACADIDAINKKIEDAYANIAPADPATFA